MPMVNPIIVARPLIQDNSLQRNQGDKIMAVMICPGFIGTTSMRLAQAMNNLTSNCKRLGWNNVMKMDRRSDHKPFLWTVG